MTEPPSDRTESTQPESTGESAKPSASSGIGLATQGPSPSMLRRLGEFFWRGERLSRAVAKQYGPSMPGWPAAKLALTVLPDADQMGETGGKRASALMLYRAAADAMVDSHLARWETPLPDGTSGEKWAAFKQHPRGAHLMASLSVEQRARVDACMQAEPGVYFATLPSNEHEVAADSLARFVHELVDPIRRDSEEIARIRAGRWFRIGAALLLLIVGVNYAIGKVSDYLATRSCVPSKTNLALHQSVSVVGRDSYSPDPSALVDGSTATIGFHAGASLTPSVTIDLGRLRCVSRVVVHNRVDCCQERAVPLKVEISSDGKQFQTVAERTEIFQTWSADFSMAKARYVKLTLMKHAPFHLAEVEVY